MYVINNKAKVIIKYSPIKKRIGKYNIRKIGIEIKEV